MNYTLSLAVLLAMVSVSQAEPCFNDMCTYQLPEDAPVKGSLTLRGPPGAISDITPAAGWEILDCDKDKLEQIIRVVCMDEAGCDHLRSHGGPDGKIVRLPQSCGTTPFALIRNSFVHDEQSIPDRIFRHFFDNSLPAPVLLGMHITNELSETTKDVNFEVISEQDGVSPPSGNTLQEPLVKLNTASSLEEVMQAVQHTLPKEQPCDGGDETVVTVTVTVTTTVTVTRTITPTITPTSTTTITTTITPMPTIFL